MVEVAVEDQQLGLMLSVAWNRSDQVAWKLVFVHVDWVYPIRGDI